MELKNNEEILRASVRDLSRIRRTDFCPALRESADNISDCVGPRVTADNITVAEHRSADPGDNDLYHSVHGYFVVEN
jgi:hypothetical protein